MEKENGDGSDAASKQPPDGLLDAAGLFGAYWGRDGGAGGGAAAQAQAQAQAQAALFGFGGTRYPPPTTLGVAANQAAQLGLHPAASAAWWSMASHLAAQDYLARLQASGLNFPHLGDPYSALSALSGVGMAKQPQKPAKPQKGGDRSGRSSSASSTITQKEKQPATSSATSQPSMRSSYGFPKTSSPSTHHSQQSLSSLASLNSLVGAPHQSKPSQTKQSSSAQSHSRSSYGFPETSSQSTQLSQQSLSSLASLNSLVGTTPHQSKPNQTKQSSLAQQSHLQSSYEFPMTSSDSTQQLPLSLASVDRQVGAPHQSGSNQSLEIYELPSYSQSSYEFPMTSSDSTQQLPLSLASVDRQVGAPHQSGSNQSLEIYEPPSHSRNKPSTSASGQKVAKERELALLRGDLMLAQAAAQGAYHAAVAAAAKGKNMSSLYPFGMGGSDKDRHGAIDSLTGLPHSILSDPASVLGGVRLPPDTEIIKYTSSLAGPKAVPGTTNRGRKKTISLDPPQVSVHPSNERGQPVPSKRQKVDEYGNSRSAVEVIRLPNRPDRQNSMPGAGTPPPNLSDYAGISRELLQTIASQSGVSLAALEKQLAGTAAANVDAGLNLSKPSGSTEDAPLDLGKTTGAEDDAPLNLSLKPTPSSSQASDALSRLTSLSSSLNASTSADRISRRKPGAKPRRVLPEPNPQIPEAPRPKSSGSEDSESVSGWPSREGRPRNLGRGVSKPKKNTVASLLAQSRALGLRPALAQQLLAETDMEKLKALLGEAPSTDSECPSDSCPSDSDASDSGRRPQDPQLRLPLALGWKRTTVIKGLSKNCNIKGDVTYTPPEPHSGLRLKSLQDIQAFLSANPCGPLTAESFSLSARLVLGEYVQPSPEPGEPRTLNEAEITKRLEEAKALAALTGGRPTPPPVDRRIELARRQQAARDARRDATARSRDQARLVRELERTERAELAKRDKEVRGQQLLEHINKNRTQLTIEPLSAKPDSDWKVPDLTGSTPRKDRRIPPISLTLIPVTGPKDACNIPIKTINLDRKDWREDLEEYSYNALDKMRDFAEKAAFDLPKGSTSKQFDFSLTKARNDRLTGKENSLERLIETYSRISEFINGCDWSKTKSPDKRDAKSIEKTYLDAKNEFMSENLMLMPKQPPKEVIDLSEDDDNVLTDIITKKIGRGTFNVGKDGALSISVHPTATNLAKRRKHEEVERQKVEEQTKRQQERELKRQQAMLLKEQERERRRQHTTFIRQLDSRRRWEERERKKHQNLLDRLLVKEKKLQSRRKEMELLSELRRPQEDSTLPDQKPLPALNRIPGLKVPGQALAHLMHVFEFLHTFGHTLGFDVETMPTLNTLQTALLPECGMEAEEELLRVLGVLLLTASEDPGIPHPGRHTTLLGHALRMGDVTDMNVSEILRIYLYANATGEVKALTGLSAERERERRIADHHQTDAEMQHTCANTKNLAYYEQLHNNSTYKLSEALRDKPYLALNPTTKAQILAYICDELLQNKLVLRQIDASLEHLNQLKKERYLLDMKIRKVRVLHQRKVRSEQSERQQALALERMQRLVEESTNNINQTGDEDNLAQNTAVPKPEDKDKPDEAEREKETATPHSFPSLQLDSDKELSPLKEVSNSMKGKEMLNNNKDECSPAENLKDKDSVMEDCDAVLSDLESEGTQPEEDEDKNLSSEELARKLERLLRQSEQQLQQVSAGTHALRATFYGQDRYWRRYWSLGKSGGIFVEGMESAQPEILSYHQTLESSQAGKEKQELDARKRRPKKGAKKELTQSEAEKMEAESESQRTQEALKSELELKNIKSELNLSDHTQIIKYEPNMKHHGTGKISGSSIKMEEKYIQHKQTKEEEDMLDIEDSIPTAFLVQKPTHKPMFAPQSESLDKPQEIVKVENLLKNETAESQDSEEPKDQLVDNLEELRKMAEAVSSQLDAAKKAEAEIKEIAREEKADAKKEIMEPDAANAALQAKMLEGKWFSILRHEKSFLSNIHEPKPAERVVYHDNEQTCSEVIQCQGHKWDVSNNLHLLNDPSLFTLNSMVTSVQVPSNSVYADSTLTLSGLDQDLLDDGACKDLNGDNAEEKGEHKKEDDNDLEKELQADTLKHEAQQRAKASGLSSLGLLNFNALSTYVTCDSPPPIQMSPEEMEQLESCKVHGLPKKQDGTFVPKELRHGWWRITDPEQLKELVEALHPRGVRERELHAALLQHIPTVNNKFVIDKGDMHATELSLSHLDRVIAQNGGYPRPDSPNSFTPATARKIDMDLLGLVEALEDRVAAAAMQVKGWRPERFPLPEDATGAEIVARARHKLAAVETHIERRYLKPPLVQSSADAAIGAALQAEQQGNNSAPSPQTSDGGGETKENAKGVSRGLAMWREAVARCNTSAQLAMLLQALEAGVAWDKSIMKASCQFCLCGDNDDQLLLCDGCDKGYHTYCFKPSMDKIPEGDWYCWECVNKARGDRVCIVCGGQQGGRTIHCALCPRAYHQDCHYPPLGKNPRGKWYCQNCFSRAPAKRPRAAKKRDSRQKDTSNSELDHTMVPSPAPSHASTSTTAEECPPSVTHTPEKCPEPENGLDHRRAPAPDFVEEEGPPPEKRRRETSREATLQATREASLQATREASIQSTREASLQATREASLQATREASLQATREASIQATREASLQATREASIQATREASIQATREASLQATREASLQASREASLHSTKEAGVQFGGNGALEHEAVAPRSENDTNLADGEEQDAENVPLLSRAKKEKTTAKRHSKEMQACKSLLCEMECHEHAWPFLLPVNTKLFPQYKKVIKAPMDLSTIKKKLQDSSYKSKDEFAMDVRLIFSNCEVFNEDDSPVGRAGHHMRQFFDHRWTLI